MSDPVLATGTPLRNLNYLRVTWNGTSFNCTAKNPPAFKDAPTWTIATDDPLQLTAETVVGKSEGLEAIELTIETDVALVYDSLQTAYLEGTDASATFTYQEGGNAGASVTVPHCRIVGLTPGGGDNNSNSTTVVKLQPLGGAEANMPTAAAIAATPSSP